MSFERELKLLVKSFRLDFFKQSSYKELMVEYKIDLLKKEYLFIVYSFRNFVKKFLEGFRGKCIVFVFGEQD